MAVSLDYVALDPKPLPPSKRFRAAMLLFGALLLRWPLQYLHTFFEESGQGEAVDELYVPIKGLEQVLARPSAPGGLQMLPIPEKQVSTVRSVFLYVATVPKELSQNVEAENARVYGARLEKLGANKYAIATGRTVDVLTGFVLTWPDAERFADMLRAADQLYGYEPKQPKEGGVRRGVVQVVLADGRNCPAYWYYQATKASHLRSPAMPSKEKQVSFWDVRLSEDVFVRQILAWHDNYVYFVRHEPTEETVVVDPGDGALVVKALTQWGWSLDYVWCTHHHNDHIGGNTRVKSATNAVVIGSLDGSQRIPGIDRGLPESAFSMEKSGLTVQVLDIPGHTRDHIAFYIPDLNALWCGDTLFSLGCGRLFEGTPRQMLSSLRKLAALPGETLVFCGHEYTASNAKFALAVDPLNAQLAARIAQVQTLRNQQPPLPTVPSTIAMEIATNPFLRVNTPSVNASAFAGHKSLLGGMLGGLLGSVGGNTRDDLAVFTRLRLMKDNF